ncbi:MAG: hypothetical protein EVA89_17210 [Sandaracinaceae bacterium]|nr:MAG: hypothetical protein EVA89_17210 [Sandaracinaceae bacterium]
MNGLAIATRNKPGRGLGRFIDWSEASAPAYAFVRPAARVDDLVVALRWLGILRGDWYTPLSIGGSTGQTFIGAMSTGTHGADFGEQPLCDAVLGLQVLTGPREVWVQAKPRAPIKTPGGAAFGRWAGCAGKPLVPVPEQAALRAGTVALGHAGVIAGALVELRRAGSRTQPEVMNERGVKRKWSSVLQDLAANGRRSTLFTAPPSPRPGEDGGAKPRYLELMPNPFTTPPTVWVVSRVAKPGDASQAGLKPHRKPLNAIGAFAQASVGHLGEAFETIVAGTRASGLTTSGVALSWAPSIEVMRLGIPGFLPSRSYEFCFPIDAKLPNGRSAYLWFADRCVQAARRHLARMVTTVRFTRPSKAPLAMQCFPNRVGLVAEVEVNFLRRFSSIGLDPSAQAALDFILLHPALGHADVRAHWGQEDTPSRLAHVSRYPRKKQWATGLRKIHGLTPTGNLPASWRSAYSEEIGVPGAFT